MKLDALLVDILDAPAIADQIEITSVTADSRYVAPGSLFAALPGNRLDGSRFVPDAISAGAAAVLTGMTSNVGVSDVPVIRADDPRRVLALLAARFYARQPENIVAVTGTSGKSSVADFVRQIFSALGRPSASIGTLGVIKPDGSVYGSLTTPDPVTLHMELAALADEGVTHLAFEASSHGLDQRRLDGVQLKAAAFTNLGRDHLDYHSTVDDYLFAKQRLFDVLLPIDGCAIIDVDRPEADVIVDVCKRRALQMIRIGTGAAADMRLHTLVPESFGQRLSISFAGATFDVLLPLIGRYQASNAMLAAGLALAVGEQPDAVFAAMNVLQGVRGRLEVVSNINGATVVIDYAHKPDALDAALDALRPFVTGKLLCVFGCGGDRDRGKRPIMGRISAKKADLTIVTDDNPRSEDPAAIRAEILSKSPGAIEIGDRYEAIGYAMMQLGPGDVLLIAGKGHETGQIIGDRVLPFSDHDAVEAVSLEL
ncbi:MAG: UDP-N-acetylmuramoyl-L-alanyl-D-glutamate--2,6-diaminopimelate ligase [Hyphomicrobiaceae bacterium]